MAEASTSQSDKMADLMQEAESLKMKLEEERQKLNDLTCMYITSSQF